VITKNFPKQDLLDMLHHDGAEEYEIVHDAIIDNTRWSIVHDLLFKHGGEFWETNYQRGATEQQDERPWEYDGDEITCINVVPVQKTITRYVPA
jgi:hypothetical protein